VKLPARMKALVFEGPGRPLQLREVEVPRPGPAQALLRVSFCGVCRTDLHIVDGELAGPRPGLILGHEITGTVMETGGQAGALMPGQRVGVPWLGGTCGQCRFCRTGQENLCDHPQFTGYTLDGGYAEYAVADHRYCFPLPEECADVGAAPLLCAGLIGYRSYRMAGPDVGKLGLYGFGAAAHIIAQVAVHEGRQVFAFTRPGDQAAQSFARRLGAVWAGDSTAPPPEPLDAAIIFAPVGSLLPAALRAVRKGGTVVCGGIHMSDIPSFPYSILWEERVVRSVANLTRRDGEELLKIAPTIPVASEVTVFPLAEANLALDRLRGGRLEGAAVLEVRG